MAATGRLIKAAVGDRSIQNLSIKAIWRAQMRTHQGDSAVSVFVSTEVSRWHSTCTKTQTNVVSRLPVQPRYKIWDVDHFKKPPMAAGLFSELFR